MGYLGQKYEKGLVIQRSEEGSAFQEDVDVTVDGDTEITPKVGGGIKKVNITGGGGTEVIANPEMEGDEPELTGLEVDGTKYKVDASNYSKEYEGQDNITYKDERSTSTAYNRFTTTSTIEAKDEDNVGAVIETNTSTQTAWGEITTEIKLVDSEGEVYEGASITMEAHVDGETGTPSSSIDIKGNENGEGAQINIGGGNDTVNINGQPYSPGTEVIANPTMSGSEANLTGLEVDGTKYKVPEQVNSDWNANSGPAQILNKPDIQTIVPNQMFNGNDIELRGLKIDRVSYKIPFGINDNLIFNTAALGKNIIQYFQERNPGWNIDEESSFRLTERVRDLSIDSGHISSSSGGFCYLLGDIVLKNESGSVSFEEDLSDIKQFDLYMTASEYGPNAQVHLNVGSYVFSGEVEDVEISTSAAFEALDFTEYEFSIDNIINLLFANDTGSVIAIAWKSNEEFSSRYPAISIQDILYCFDLVTD